MKAKYIPGLAPALAGIALLLLACENPFRVGLGEVVDMHHPTVSMTSPGSGAFVRGNQPLAGVAGDDLAVASVYFRIMDYPVPPAIREGHSAGELLRWQRVELSLPRSNEGVWTHSIPTYVFLDGEIRVQLRVTDGAGNVVVTDGIVLFVNNDPPAISMSLPALASGSGDGELGGDNLNFGFAGDLNLLDRRVDARLGMVAGTITHGEGVFVGYPAAPGRFPPQFRVWEVRGIHDDPLPGLPIFPAGVLPGEEQAPWQRLGHDAHGRSELTLMNHPGSLQFLYDFSALGEEAHNRFFAFQLRAQSVRESAGDGFETVLFPGGKWSPSAWEDLSPEQRVENSFVAFFLAGPQVPPGIQLLGLQNIMYPGAWDPDLRGGEGDYRDMPGVPYDHNFLTDQHFNVTRGPFTMRVRAFHPEGVAEAMAFWETGGRRGRFVWDPATGHPEPDNNVDAGLPFSRWGLASGNLHATRHFVFTRGGGGRIEFFGGDNWAALYSGITSPEGWDRLRDDSQWREATPEEFGEGTFTVTIHVRTELGTVNAVPRTTTLAIDVLPPAIEITQIVGGVGELGRCPDNDPPTVVNDVIEAQFFVSDDTGLRASGGLFARPNGAPSDEVLFVLVCDSEAGVVNSLPGYFWPLNAPGDILVSIPGSNVIRQGAVLDGRARLCTADLRANQVYRIFVFARDRAFNVGRASFRLRVEPDTDFPVFDFSMGIVNAGVREPSAWVEGLPEGDPNHGTGFRIGQGGPRNMLRPGHDIRFSVSDDDSLYLVSGSPYTLGIWITRSYFYQNHAEGGRWEIRPEGAGVRLPDSRVKEHFRPQGVDGAGRRLPVRGREGTIPQRYFAEALGAPHAHLPDGIYRITVRVYDCPHNKLTMPPAEPAARPYRYSEASFWIVVDNEAPEIVIERFYGGHLYGRFRDELAPMPLDGISLRVTPDAGVGFTLYHDRLGLVRRDPVRVLPGNWVWEYDFRANLPELSYIATGNVDFVMAVPNRFGNSVPQSWRHSVDIVPPEVTVRGISTFARPSAAGRHGITPANAGRLANMVLDFNVGAMDDASGIARIHWWLLPPGESVGTFTHFPSDERDHPPYGEVRHTQSGGVFGRVSPLGGTIVVDTLGLGLDDGEYWLHVIAVDGAGNPSVGGDLLGEPDRRPASHFQTIYLLQYEDRPYIRVETIQPRDGAARGHDLGVTGTIEDDDGFGAGMFSDPGTVEVWISPDNNLAGEPGTAAMLAAGWHRAEVPSDALNLVGGELRLAFALQNLNWQPGFAFGDGTWHYVIRVQDSPANKVPPPPGSPTPERAVSYSPVFHFVRDVEPPVLVLDSPEPGRFVSGAGFYISGSIADFSIYRNPAGHPVLFWSLNHAPLQPLALDNTGGITVTSTTDSAGRETVEFTIDPARVLQILGSGPGSGLVDGINTLQFRARDIPGAFTDISRTFTRDTTPPEVHIRSRISTFSRPSARDRHPALDISVDNADRLANMELHFAVDATDNVSVAGIHWWLLPSAVDVTDFMQYPADRDHTSGAFGFDVAGGGRGAFGRIAAPGGVASIDTFGLGLADGEYRLHVIAMDGGGNQSIDGPGVTGVVQTIFLLQEEDRPYFAERLSPRDGEVRGHDLVVTGAVSDDDGFGIGMSPAPGTVRVWISHNPLADGVEPSGAAMLAAGWHYAYASSGLTLIDGRDLVMEIDLYELFGNSFVFRDGMKYYVVRVQDFAGEGAGLYSYRYSEVFHFMRDVLPPVLSLTQPTLGGVVMEDTLRLTGFVGDANLRRYGGNPYLLWRLNGVGALARLPLVDGVNATRTVEDGIETFAFDIEPDVVMGLFGDAINDGDGNDGSNTLELRVEDMTGAFAEVSRSFVMDGDVPSISLDISKVEMDWEHVSWTWWDPPTTDAADLLEWNNERREWAAEKALSVISVPETAEPTLGGSFADDVSYIDVSSAFFWINNGPRENIPIEPHERGRTVNWTIPLTVGGQRLPDGVHTIRMEVRDMAGNRAYTPEIAFRIDSDVPEIGLLGYRPPVLAAHPDPFVRGTARDANLRDVRLELRRNGVLVPPYYAFAPGPTHVYLVAASGNPGVNGDDWSYPDGQTMLAWDLDLTLAFPGLFGESGASYEITVRAVDFAGNLSEPERWTFTWDNLPPTIAFPGLRPGTNDNLGPTSPALLYPDGAAFNRIDRDVIRVDITDAHSGINNVQALIQPWSWAAAEGGWPATASWSGDLDLDDPDLFGGSPRNRILNLSMGDRPDGLYRVRVRAADSAWRGPGNVPPEWAYSDWLYFYYSRGNPVIVFDPNTPLDMSSRYGTGVPAVPGDPENPGIPGAPGYLTFRVTATYANRIRSVTATVAGDASRTATVDVNVNDWANPGATVTIPVPVDINADHGNFPVTITATSLSGRTAPPVTRTITLDNRSPGGGFNTPASDEVLLSGQRALITGMTDAPGLGIARVYFRPGLLDSAHVFDVDALAIAYTAANAALDTRRNDHIFADAETWFLLEQGAQMPPHFRLLGHHTFNWQLEVPLVEPGDPPGPIRVPDGAGGFRDSRGIVEFTDMPGMTNRVGDVYHLPIWFRVVDRAGNAGFFGQTILIDPDGDRPYLRVDGWDNERADQDGQRGGTIVFGGAALIPSPYVPVHSVLYRVFVGPPGSDRPPTSVTGAQMGISEENLASAGELAVLARSGYTFLHGGNWFRANLQGGGNNVPWNFTLNALGEITALIPSSDTMIRVWVEMVALSDDTAAGKTSLGSGVILGVGTPEAPRPTVREFYLRSTAPQISDVRVNTVPLPIGTAAPLPPLRGTFTITALLDAAEDQTITDVRIGRPDEVRPEDRALVMAWYPGIDADYILEGLTVVPYPADQSRFFRLTYSIDTTALYGGVWMAGGGVYNVDIRIRDNSNPRMEGAVNVPVRIDNFAPAIDPTGGNRFQVGRNAQFQSTAFDFQGPVPPAGFTAASVDRVYAWFERSINGVPHFVAIDDRPTAGGIEPVPSADLFPGEGPRDRLRRTPVSGADTDPHEVWRGRMASVGANGNVTVVPGSFDRDPEDPSCGYVVSVPTGAFLRVINRSTAAPDPGLLWVPSHYVPGLGYRQVNWVITLNTLLLDDGPITLRYIVWDTAGSASFHEQHIVIKNNFPIISDVILHTSVAPGNFAVRHQGPDGIDPNVSMRLSLAQTQSERGLGFIDSGFIARNQFIGFTVNTMRGNAPLNYRVQAVTRERITLNDAEVARMRADRTNANMINMYTVVSAGNVSMANWIAMGVSGVTDPASLPGTHFVFTGAAGLPPGMTGEVWRYIPISGVAARQAMGRADSARVVRPNRNDAAVSPSGPVSGGTVAYPYTAGDNFNFWGVNLGDPTVGDFIYDPDGFTVVGPDDELRPDLPRPTRIPQFLVTDRPYGEQNHPGDHRRPFFLLRVWDSVTSGAHASLGALGENYQLHTAAVIYMDIYTYDDYRPSIMLHDLMPGLELESVIRANALDPGTMFYSDANRNVNRTRGGLYNQGTLREPARSGYIEPATYRTGAGVGTANAAAVSGQIILRGRATDNRRIDYIQLATVPGAGVTRAPGTGANAGRYVLSNVAEDAWRTILRRGVGGTMQAAPGFEGVVGVRETSHWWYGNVVEWSFLWNTEDQASGNPVGNVVVAARTRDHYPELFSDENFIRVDIVPYVTRMERRSPYATLRSMQGWYSFYQGETGIRALGWNLGAGGTMNIQHGPTGADVTAITMLTGAANRTHNMITFNMPDTARSGRINITVGTGGAATPIHNHNSNPAHAWNRDNLFGTHSELWNNRPHAHVWRTAGTSAAPRTYMGPLANSMGLDHPGMALEYSGGGGVFGRLHGTWSVYGDDMVHYGRNDGYGITGLGTGSEATRLASRTVVATSPGLAVGAMITSPGDPFVTPDISMFGGGGVPNIAFVHQWDGNESVMFRSDLNSQVPLTSTPLASPLDTHAPASGNHAGQTEAGIVNFPFVIGFSGGPTPRWQNIRTASAATSTASVGDPGVLYTAAFDRWRRSLVFVTRQGTTNTMVIIDGPTGFDIPTGPADAGLPSGNIPRVTGGVTNSSNAGEFSAVGFDGTGPIVAYFANNTVRIAFGNGTAPAAGSWTRRYALSTGHGLRFGSGTYISMAVDRTGGIHLAFFNTRYGALVYAHAASRDAAINGGFTAVVVDTMEDVGTWTDISVDHWGNPWIVYGYQGRQGNYDGIRMAFRSRNPVAHANNVAAGSGNTGVHFIAGSGWEAVQMASPFRVRYDRLNIEAWPPSNRAATAAAPLTMAQAHLERGAVGGRAWGAAIGYSSGGADRRFRIGYFFWPVGIGATWPPAAADAAQ